MDQRKPWSEIWSQEMLHFARSLAAGGLVGEDDGRGRRGSIDERLVQAIWSDQLLRSADLTTASGKAVEVLEPGRWNTGRGPDFSNARIRIAGEVVEGDVEIHVESAQWTRHGHHQDFEYNTTVLHVVLFASDDRPYEEKQNGRRLERLVLEHVLEPDLDTLRQTLNLNDYPHGEPATTGLCHQQFLRLAPEQLEGFLSAAGMARFEQKVARLTAQRNSSEFEQLVYQALMTAQGYKSSKSLYFLLARRAPISELRDFAKDFPSLSPADVYLSILLSVANLLPAQLDLVEPDEETTRMLTTARQVWGSARRYYTDRILPPTRRWFAGVRPAGFPGRRLAAVSVLVARLFDGKNPAMQSIEKVLREMPVTEMSAKEIRKAISDLVAQLVVEGDGNYFGTHYTIGGKKGKQLALMGEPAAQSALYNTILPVLIVRAREIKDKRLEANCWALASLFPSLERNGLARMMENRIFGPHEPSGLKTREIFQQSLLKVFTDCCSHNEKSCADCKLFELAEGVGKGA